MDKQYSGAVKVDAGHTKGGSPLGEVEKLSTFWVHAGNPACATKNTTSSGVNYAVAGIRISIFAVTQHSVDSAPTVI